MYVRQIRDEAAFIDAVIGSGKPVSVSERAVAAAVTEQGGVVVRPALERHYAVEMHDDLQGETRLVFTERLLESDGAFPFDRSAYEKLKRACVRIIELGRISHAA